MQHCTYERSGHWPLMLDAAVAEVALQPGLWRSFEIEYYKGPPLSRE